MQQTSAPCALVLGVDAGGTGSRAVLAGLDGRALGRAAGAGANPTTHGLRGALTSLRDTLARALAGHDPAGVRQVVLGLAGQRSLRAGAGARELAAMLRAVGLTCPYRLVGDAEVAFASATPAADGRLLISGTGSIAVRLRDREIADTAGGYGWLFGDEGSGYWLGREAARLAVDTLRGHADSRGLTRRVTAALAAPAEADGLLAALYARPPLELATLAPLVTEAAAEGDPAARALLGRGAAHLITLVRQLGHLDGPEPVVLAGSCLAPAVLGADVTQSLRASGATVLRADDAASGAAWLAARELLPPHTATARHHTLCGTPQAA